MYCGVSSIQICLNPFRPNYCYYTFGTIRLTISRSRFFAICEWTKKILNLARAIRGFELESILIIIYCDLEDIEKRGDGL
jgi:hypothetical protein